jgi:hopanoid-associated phosphorylase
VTLLIATGLRREARVMAGDGIAVIAGGGDAERLEQALEAAIGSVSGVLSSGFAGALDPELGVGEIVIGGVSGSESFAKRLAKLLPHARIGLVAGRDQVAGSATEKRALWAETGALAVDMESHIAARVAARHGLPFAALRVISDEADATLPPAALAGMRPDGGIAIGAVLGSLLRKPRQLPALLRTGRDAGVAFQALRSVHHVLRRSGIGGFDAGQLTLDMR